MSDFQVLVEKILSDQNFRRNLVNNPEATLRAQGINPNDELMEALDGVTEDSLQELVNNFQEDKAAK
jgi:hypothetical protein